jgi:carbohydrate-selective porin OprB
MSCSWFLNALVLAPVQTAAVAPDTATERLEVAPAPEIAPLPLYVAGTVYYQSLFDSPADADFLSGYLDIVLERPLWEGAVGVLELEAIGGNGPDTNVPAFGATVLGWNGGVGSAQDPNGYDRVYLAEIFASMELGYDLVLDLGKIASTSYIDTNRVANDATTQFTTGAFANSNALQVPFRGGGLALTWLGSSYVNATAFAMRPDNAGAEASSDLFLGGGLTFAYEISGQNGEFKPFVTSLGSQDDQMVYGFSMDQDFGSKVTGFGRYAHQEEDDLNPQDVDTAWSCGLECRELFDRLENDTVGLAYGQTKSHDNNLDTEGEVEVYLKQTVNDHFEWTAYFQSLSHPGGDPNLDVAHVGGLRLQFYL